MLSICPHVKYFMLENALFYFCILEKKKKKRKEKEKKKKKNESKAERDE